MKRNSQNIARTPWAALASLDPRPKLRPMAHLVGARNPNAKLGEVDVARMRRLYAMAIELGCAPGQVKRGLAVCFAIHPRTVGKIVYGERRGKKESL